MMRQVYQTLQTDQPPRRLPSTRPIDHRWDVSRGIVFANAARTLHRESPALNSSGPTDVTPYTTTRTIARRLGSPYLLQDYPDSITGNLLPGNDRDSSLTSELVDQNKLLKSENDLLKSENKTLKDAQDAAKQDFIRQRRELNREKQGLAAKLTDLQKTSDRAESDLQQARAEQEALRKRERDSPRAEAELERSRTKLQSLEENYHAQIKSLERQHAANLEGQEKRLREEYVEKRQTELKLREDRKERRNDYQAYRKSWESVEEPRSVFMRKMRAMEDDYDSIIAQDLEQRLSSWIDELHKIRPNFRRENQHLIDQLEKWAREQRGKWERALSQVVEWQRACSDKVSLLRLKAHESRILTRHHRFHWLSQEKLVAEVFYFANESPFKLQMQRISQKRKELEREIADSTDKAREGELLHAVHRLSEQRIFVRAIKKFQFLIRQKQCLETLRADEFAEMQAYFRTRGGEEAQEQALYLWGRIGNNTANKRALSLEAASLNFFKKKGDLVNARDHARLLALRISLLDDALGQRSPMVEKEVQSWLEREIETVDKAIQTQLDRFGSIWSRGSSPNDSSVVQLHQMNARSGPSAPGQIRIRIKRDPTTCSKPKSINRRSGYLRPGASRSAKSQAGVRLKAPKPNLKSQSAAQPKDRDMHAQLEKGPTSHDKLHPSQMTSKSAELAKSNIPNHSRVRRVRVKQRASSKLALRKDTKTAEELPQGPQQASDVKPLDDRKVQSTAALNLKASPLMLAAHSSLKFGKRDFHGTSKPFVVEGTRGTQASVNTSYIASNLCVNSSASLSTLQNFLVHAPLEKTQSTSMAKLLSSSEPAHAPMGLSSRKDPEPVADGASTKITSDNEVTYNLSLTDLRRAAMSSASSKASCWSYTLYKNAKGDKPVLHLCTTYDQAEQQLRKFLDKTVLGFDIEWEPFAQIGTHSIKQNVSLIQLAADDRIALCQIATFSGKTAEELMPPTLRAILESDKVSKCGVNVVGDARRINQCFNMEMRGLFELSHLYNLVTYAQTQPRRVNKKLVSLAEQVQRVLLLPLDKGAVRTSAWSWKLNPQQAEYAASDAYAGLRLYYEMEERRKQMDPMPPTPALYELQEPIRLATMPIGEPDASDEEDVFFDALETQEDGGVTPASTLPSLGDNLGHPELFSVDNQKLSAHVEDMTDLVECLQEASRQDQQAKSDKSTRQRRLWFKPEKNKAAASSGNEAAQIEQREPSTEIPTNDQMIQDTSTVQAPVESTSTTKPSSKSKAPILTPDLAAAVHRADLWAESYRTNYASKVLAGHASLRAYHLWHTQYFSLPQIARLLRDPPLSPSTVAGYVLQAVQFEKLQYDIERIRKPLAMGAPAIQMKRFPRVWAEVQAQERI